MSVYQNMKLADRYGGTADEWGGEHGRLERVARQSLRQSRHRRECQAEHLRVHRFRLLLFGLMAVPGLALLTWQLLEVTPTGWMIVLGAALMLPWLVELGEG